MYKPASRARSVNKAAYQVGGFNNVSGGLSIVFRSPLSDKLQQHKRFHNFLDRLFTLTEYASFHEGSLDEVHRKNENY